MTFQPVKIEVIDDRPQTIGVFGGSFNPIHLGHALLAITTQQTKPVDKVLLVPVYQHAVKKDLLPYEDRVAMCRLAVAPFASSSSSRHGDATTSVEVSRIEQLVGASNGAMLRGIQQQYPQAKLLYICGDDFFRWMERPKGLETLKEVQGLIVQRRLHKQEADRFYKEPLDEQRIRAVCAKLGLELDFIYGELPHFSSTLVRRAPGHWRSFLPQSVTEYLDERPHLLEKLIANLEADAQRELQQQEQASETTTTPPPPAQTPGSEWVMRGLEAVHCLQRERGSTGLWLSSGTNVEALKKVQGNTDAVVKEITSASVDESDLADMDEVLTLAEELRQIPVWLDRDRKVLQKRQSALMAVEGVGGWMSRLDMVQKFNARIDVLMEATIRALKEIRQSDEKDELPDLLYKWCEGKEALGRERAFVCAGGPSAHNTVRHSLKMRNLLNEVIDTKERSLARVWQLHEGVATRLAAPDTVHRLLEKVTVSEWSLMGCFASSTKPELVHTLLERQTAGDFNVKEFFESSSSAIDFLLSFSKALAASGCASSASDNGNKRKRDA